MQISKYVKEIELDEDIILFHTVEHSMLVLPKELVVSHEIDDGIDEESKQTLDEMGYLANRDKIIESNLATYFINEDKLFISLELNLSCNLRCPYCYQLGKERNSLISEEDLEWLLKYISRVYQETFFKELYIKILGGEPTLAWNRFMYIFNGAKEFCNNKGIKFNVLVDTNGTRIEDLIELKGYDSLLLTIPLTYKDCHDAVRFDVKGNGTYNQIINNINEIKRIHPDTKIVIRYNVDNNNIGYFHAFLHDIKGKLSFSPLISINYTAELNGDENYENVLSYDQFVKWISTDAIDYLAAMELPITVSPIISVEECQFRSKHSLKLFSDGTIGSCAMTFFENNRENISDIVELFGDDNSFSKKKAKQTIMADKECLECDSLFICGGTNKLPCIKALDSKMCEEKRFGISLKDFLLRYLKYQEEGKGNLFVVFEDGESYR